MLLYMLSALSVAILGLASANKLTIPVNTCKRDSPDYSACLKHMLEEIWPGFMPGIPESEIPSLDPVFYEYGEVVINSDKIRAKVILINCTIFGLSKLRFLDIRPHFLNDVFRLEIDTLLPRIFMQGTVNMNGTVGDVIRVANEGPFNVTTDDVRGTAEFIGHIANDTWIVEHVRMLPSIKKLTTYFDLFPGNKQLNDLAMTFANEFWPLLYKVVMPIVSDAWDPWITNLINRIFSKISFSEMFP